MPRRGALAGGGRTVRPRPTRCGRRDVPLPSFAPPAPRWPARCPPRRSTCSSTLPLYAAFLDEPFDPSPYAPVSRLHWNEVYLDDSPAAGGPSAGDPRPADRLARARRRRRRRQLLDRRRRSRCRTSRRTSRGSPPSGPTSPTFAGFRTERREPTDAGRPTDARRRQPRARPVPRPPPARGDRRPPGRAIARARPADRQPPGRLRDVGQPGTVRHGDDRRRAARRVLHRRSELGLPAAAPGRGRRGGPRAVATLVGGAGEHASMLRIDHVMGVHRLWWVPDGAPRQRRRLRALPREELLAVIAAEAAVPARRSSARTSARCRGGRRRARPVGRARHVRGAVPPRPPPARPDPGALRRRVCAPTTWRRSPPRQRRRPTGGRLPRPVAERPRPSSRRRRRACSTPRSSGWRASDAVPRRRRSRRPRRRDDAAQRPRPGAARRLAATAPATDVGGAGRSEGAAPPGILRQPGGNDA